ncbi:GSCFA domain-containing protein [Caulobacter sp. S45]|uniref:GSCFA domain-containing protein n=1 Tax=Caulobacter sp. S45 TaxID=1641861 RepID=UPI00131B9954|nr:GSCFA domain-containing protein [Caulobacter sp. S45]
MTRGSPEEIDPVVAQSWRISAHDRIATAGSCFAQHVSRRLRGSGLDLLDVEPAHPILSAETADAYGYGHFSARFGAIYTARQLLQLLRRSFGQFVPEEDVWFGMEGRLFDPFRPTIQPRGYPTRREYDLDRAGHFRAVRKMFETATVLIFTLGLTECWRSKLDGAVYPLCPGVAAGQFDPERHEFHNLSVSDTIGDLDAFVTELRRINPDIRIILTVSPVPLAATAERRHVWTSTTASKAVLRVAAEEMTRTQNIIYFPSYEIITSPTARGRYLEEDLRTISAAGVDHVMRLFFKHMVEGASAFAPPSHTTTDPFLQRAERAVDVICDEARLDPAD